MSKLNVKATEQDVMDKVKESIEQASSREDVEIVKRDGGTWAKEKSANGLIIETRLS